MYSGRAAFNAWMAEANSLQSQTVTSWRVWEAEGKVFLYLIRNVCPKQHFQSYVKYLISQDGERPLQSAGWSILGGSGKPLSVVADLSLERVDVGDDLFGSDDVLRYVDDGLRAGQGAATESKETWF